jgi:hypothetical protein
VAIRRLSDARLLVPFWYGLRKGYRGRFGMYLPPLLEALGKVELTHELRNNKARALVWVLPGSISPAVHEWLTSQPIHVAVTNETGCSARPDARIDGICRPTGGE